MTGTGTTSKFLLAVIVHGGPQSAGHDAWYTNIRPGSHPDTQHTSAPSLCFFIADPNQVLSVEPAVLRKRRFVVLRAIGPRRGRAFTDSTELDWTQQLFLAVFAVNFHGSTGFGHEFCRSISQNWVVGPTDVITGTQACLAEHGALIDAGRVAALGVSLKPTSTAVLHGKRFWSSALGEKVSRYPIFDTNAIAKSCGVEDANPRHSWC